MSQTIKAVLLASHETGFSVISFPLRLRSVNFRELPAPKTVALIKRAVNRAVKNRRDNGQTKTSGFTGPERSARNARRKEFSRLRAAQEFGAPKSHGKLYGSLVNPEPNPSAVPPQIPVRLERYEHDVPPKVAKRFWLHPASGVLILAVDWFFFGPEFVTAEAAAIITCPLAFIVTTIGVCWIQRRKHGDSRKAALVKGFIGGVLAGIPTSISGTIFGTAVLVLSGLSNWRQRREEK
jgi:hypothetical protein